MVQYETRLSSPGYGTGDDCGALAYAGVESVATLEQALDGLTGFAVPFDDVAVGALKRLCGGIGAYMGSLLNERHRLDTELDQAAPEVGYLQLMDMSDPIEWLLKSDEPWTRYRTLVDLLDRPEGDNQVQAARGKTLAHPQVQALIAEAGTWPCRPLTRHSDASHPIYKLSTLADFGLRAGETDVVADIDAGIEAVMAHQSPEGAFQSLVNVPKAFGGTGEDMWTWMLCDAPTLLYALLAMGAQGTAPGLDDDPRVQRAVDHLVGLVEENGWRCAAARELGKFRGPGRKHDPCPIVNVFALKALAQASARGKPELLGSPAAHAGAEMLLWHWEHQAERKIYMFGIGTDFRKLKYPFVWYNVLHVVDVLSRFPFVHADPRCREMVETITAQADEDGRYTAGSMYRAWKGWSFADKKRPSPWLTFLVRRIQKRVSQQPGDQ